MAEEFDRPFYDAVHGAIERAITDTYDGAQVNAAAVAAVAAPAALAALEELADAEEGAFADEADIVEAYTITPEVWAVGDQPTATLNCNHDECAVDVLADEEPPHTLGTILDLAAQHEATHDGYQPEQCTVADLPDVGEMRIQGDLDAEGRQAMSEVIKATQRKATAELKAAGVREFAAYLERHPFHAPMRSGIYAELAREKADCLEAGEAL